MTRANFQASRCGFALKAGEGPAGQGDHSARSEDIVIILLIIGFVAKIAILWAIGIILVVIGVIPWILRSLGDAVRGRRHYW